MRRSDRFRQIVLLGFSVQLFVTLGAGPAKPKLPSFDEVRKTAIAYFDGQSNFTADQIISQSQVRGLFEKLQGIGWVVPEQSRILELVPGDHETLVRDLRTPDGRKFSKQLAPLPNAFDRLDRLIRMPTGRSAVARLIKGPDGVWLLQYMTEDPGGAAMGRMLSHTPTGKGFNKPTGRLYTVSALINELQGVYPPPRKR
ncbi:MAG TPA: hypothetical protein VGJ26_14700 [Pirellulales bacterium]|jgi:hypothetical protein